MSTPSEALKSALGFPATPSQKPEPRFAGDQRSQAIKLLGRYLLDGRQDNVLQLINHDPSLIWESLPGVGTNGNLPFPVACLQCEMLAGVLVAISKGYDINTPCGYDNNHGWLITHAVNQSNTEAVLLLLSLGASASTLPGAGRSSSNETPTSLLGTALSSWMVSDAGRTDVPPPRMAYALLDAGGEIQPDVGTDLVWRLVTGVSPARWGEQEFRKHATALMGRLIKAGANPNGKPDSPSDPMTAALGRKNGHALEALVAFGADVTSKRGDILDRMRANGMEEFIPAVQAQLMSRTIDRAVAQAQSASGGAISPTGATATPRSPTSRRASAGI